MSRFRRRQDGADASDDLYAPMNVTVGVGEAVCPRIEDSREAYDAAHPPAR